MQLERRRSSRTAFVFFRRESSFKRLQARERGRFGGSVFVRRSFADYACRIMLDAAAPLLS